MKNTATRTPAPVAGCRLAGEARQLFALFARRYNLTAPQVFALQSEALSWADRVGLWCNGQPCAGPFGALARGLARRGVILPQGAGWAWAPEALSELWAVAQAQAEAEGLPPVPALTDAAPAPAQAAPEAAPAPAAPLIADAALEASAALNAEGEAATARALAGIGRIRQGLAALEALEAPRPVLPGEATPPLAPSHGDRAPALPVITERPCPVGNGAPARAEAVVEVPGGVAVITTGSDREAFRLPGTVSLCGAAAALEAGGWLLSPALEARAQAWRNFTGEQDPAPEAVAIAEAAAPLARNFEVFHRTWWQAPGVPGVGRSHHVGWAQTEARARYLCRRWNAAHTPGPLSDRAEFTAA